MMKIKLCLAALALLAGAAIANVKLLRLQTGTVPCPYKTMTEIRWLQPVRKHAPAMIWSL